MMSKIRKSIKADKKVFHASGTAISDTSCPATSSITTNCGSFAPDIRETLVAAGMPMAVTSKARPITAGSRNKDGRVEAKAAQRITVTADPQVPGPGRNRPMPKKVAISMAPALEFRFLQPSSSSPGALSGIRSSSSETAEGIAYAPLAQFPRSIVRQRSLQNGKSGSSRLTSFLQIGQRRSSLCFSAMGYLERYNYLLFLQKFRYQIVIVSFCDLAAIKTARFRSHIGRKIVYKNFAVDLRRVHRSPSLEQQFGLLRCSFQQQIKLAAHERLLFLFADSPLNLHQMLAPALDFSR